MTGCDKQVLAVLTALKNGDLSARLPEGEDGTAGEIAETFNAFVDQMNAIVKEFNRLSREMGIEGRFGGQAEVYGLSGTWLNVVDNVNMMARLLTLEVRSMAAVATLTLNAGQIGEPPTNQNEIQGLGNAIVGLAKQVSQQRGHSSAVQ
jgi:HAMP domain-containing protein